MPDKVISGTMDEVRKAAEILLLNQRIKKDNPTPGDVHINALLTGFSAAYIQDQTRFIATRVAPRIRVAKQSNYYRVWPKGSFMRDRARKRAPATESAGGRWTYSTDQYQCDVYAFHKDLDNQTLANADNPADLSIGTQQYLTGVYLLTNELQWRDDFFVTGKWTRELTGSSNDPGSGEFLQWGDEASTPIQDIKAEVTYILKTTGIKPNTLILGKNVYDKLIEHPDILDRVKGGATPGQPAVANVDLLKTLFEIPNIEVLEAVYDSAQEGQSANLGFIAGDNALLCYVPPVVSEFTPMSMATFVWTGLQGQDGQNISQFYMDKEKATRYEIEYANDMKMIGADLGTFFLNAYIASGSGPGV